jgi:FkbM family methyltransferase
VTFKNRITHQIINRPAFFLSEDNYSKYIIKVSKFLSLFKLAYPLSMRVEPSNLYPKVNIYRITGGPTELLIQSKYRVSRFMKGFEYAGKRQWNRYQISELINNAKIDTIIDVGANVGEISYFAYCQKIRNIYAIDPDPLIAEILDFNLHSTNAVIDKRALGISNSEVYFYIQTASADSSLLRPNEAAKSVKVKCITLDRFFQDHEIWESHGTILLKMDAEGFEPEILRSGLSALNIIKFLAIDTGPERNGTTTTKEVSSILTSVGFKILSTNSDIILAINQGRF